MLSMHDFGVAVASKGNTQQDTEPHMMLKTYVCHYLTKAIATAQNDTTQFRKVSDMSRVNFRQNSKFVEEAQAEACLVKDKISEKLVALSL